MKFMLIDIPREDAFTLARKTHAATSMDAGYQVKTVLAEASIPLRPWRFLASDPMSYRICGAVDGDVETSALTNLGGSVCATADWEPENDMIELDLHVTPQLQCRFRDVPGDRDLPRRSRLFDAAVGSHDRSAAYRDWVANKIQPASAGIEIDGDIQIAFVRDVRVPRKFEDRRVKLVMIPSCRARFKANVTDLALFRNTVSGGIGRQRAFGFGSLIPRTVLSSLASHGGFADAA